MSLDNKKTRLRDFLKNKRVGLQGTSGSKPLPTLPLPPPPPTTELGLLPIPNLKKKRKDQELEEGEVVPQKGAK